MSVCKYCAFKDGKYCSNPQAPKLFKPFPTGINIFSCYLFSPVERDADVVIVLGFQRFIKYDLKKPLFNLRKTIYLTDEKQREC